MFKVSGRASDKLGKAIQETKCFFAEEREEATVLALTTNFMAFYFAAALFERTGILCAVTVFLVTALAGTFIASVIEESLPPCLSKGFNASGGNRAARPEVPTPLP
jgi:hypothetical protein